MNYLADQKEKDYDLESKVKGAMIYPAFILAVLGVVGFIAMAFIIPNITALLVESGAPMPLLTRILMGVAGFFNHFWWLIIIIVVGFAGGWLAWIKTEMGRNFFDQAKLRIPVFGKIFRQIYIVRICRSFATLIRGGVPIATALDIVKEVADNKVYEKILAEAVKAVDEGNPLSEALLDPNIPVVVSQLVSVGEETGKLDEVLERAAEFYAREVDNMVKNLSTLIEPAIMVFLGLTVGLFVAAVILPMWQLSSSF
jgi:type IV pilus assembly protein PilC